MSKAKYTRGPWVAVDATVYTAGTGSRRKVAECQFSSATAIHETDEANARLIAAAPELLEALKEWKVYMECNYSQEDVSFWQKTVDAVAKAEGESK